MRVCVCPSAYPAYGLGNSCSDNNDNRQSGVTFHHGVQREIGSDLGGQGQGQGSNVRRAIFISSSDQHQNNIPGVNGRCKKHGRLRFNLKGQGQGSTLASSISCSDKDKNDIPRVNVRCEKCDSLRFYFRGQGQGQGLCQRCAQQRSC